MTNLFKPFGEVRRVVLVKEKATREFRGLAFVHFVKEEDAKKALAAAATLRFAGKHIEVDRALRRQKDG